jgi:hypothetical protein
LRVELVKGGERRGMGDVWTGGGGVVNDVLEKLSRVVVQIVNVTNNGRNIDHLAFAPPD